VALWRNDLVQTHLKAGALAALLVSLLLFAAPFSGARRLATGLGFRRLQPLAKTRKTCCGQWAGDHSGASFLGRFDARAKATEQHRRDHPRRSAGYYHPREIVADPLLTIARKRALLARWLSDANALPNAPAIRRSPAGVTATVDDIRLALDKPDEMVEACWLAVARPATSPPDRTQVGAYRGYATGPTGPSPKLLPVANSHSFAASQLRCAVDSRRHLAVPPAINCLISLKIPKSLNYKDIGPIRSLKYDGRQPSAPGITSTGVDELYVSGSNKLPVTSC
jgi:hypothetical protein